VGHAKMSTVPSVGIHVSSGETPSPTSWPRLRPRAGGLSCVPVGSRHTIRKLQEAGSRDQSTKEVALRSTKPDEKK